MQRLFPSTQSPTGTSFWGHTIRTSFNEIMKAFPGLEVGDADKSRYHMVFELLDGSVVTLYDYKEWGIQDDSIVDFHIGGHKEIVTAEAQRILKSMVVN